MKRSEGSRVRLKNRGTYSISNGVFVQQERQESSTSQIDCAVIMKSNLVQLNLSIAIRRNVNEVRQYIMDMRLLHRPFKSSNFPQELKREDCSECVLIYGI